jgi:hypothetical protein
MPDFPRLAEVVVDAAEVSHETGHPFGPVGVEIVADHLPSRRRGRGEHSLQERHEIHLGASIADGAADFARGDIERRDQGFGAMADILELPPFDLRASSAGSARRVPAPGYRSSRRSIRSAHPTRAAEEAG